MIVVQNWTDKLKRWRVHADTCYQVPLLCVSVALTRITFNEAWRRCERVSSPERSRFFVLIVRALPHMMCARKTALPPEQAGVAHLGQRDTRRRGHEDR